MEGLCVQIIDTLIGRRHQMYVDMQFCHLPGSVVCQ